MQLPVMPPVAPMLAKGVKDVTTVPEPSSVAGGLLYEPKWDGFRDLVSGDPSSVATGQLLDALNLVRGQPSVGVHPNR
nr:hypothetical protein [Quadrisphaera sp. RL12-1S]